jgi:kumamolisin
MQLAAAIVSIVVLIAGGLTATAGAQPEAAAVTPSDPARPFDPLSLGAADPGAVIEVSFALRPRDPEGQRRFLDELYDPASPSYRRFLTPTEIGVRFGITDSDLHRVEGRLSVAGLEVVDSYPQRTSLRVRGSVAALSDLLGVPIEQLQDPRNGTVYVAAVGTPRIPGDLAGLVAGVTGLDRWLPVSAIDPADRPPLPTRGLKPIDIARAYGFESLWQAGITGDQTAVAIIQFGVDTDEDLAVFDAEFGITGPTPERLTVGEGLVNAPADFATEAVLDTQVLRAVAPDTQILVYGAGAREPFSSIVDRIVADGRAQLASLSYGKCYDPGEYMSEIEQVAGQISFEAAAAAGVNIFAASGDWGAFSCHAFVPSDHRAMTFWPSCANDVISVGGTFLRVREDGTYRDEIGWQDYLVTGGTGGGLSPTRDDGQPYDARPEHQAGVPGIDNSASNGSRQCPDVSASADPDTGYLIFETDPDLGPTWKMIGGTSAAAPMWAGSMALVQQYAQEQGVTEPLGFLNPMFYRIAVEQPDAFNDVVRGGNLLDTSTTGWDYATGLGSPNVQRLAEAVVQQLQQP